MDVSVWGSGVIYVGKLFINYPREGQPHNYWCVCRVLITCRLPFEFLRLVLKCSRVVCQMALLCLQTTQWLQNMLSLSWLILPLIQEFFLVALHIGLNLASWASPSHLLEPLHCKVYGVLLQEFQVVLMCLHCSDRKVYRVSLQEFEMVWLYQPSLPREARCTGRVWVPPLP